MVVHCFSTDWKHEIQLQPFQLANKQQIDRNLNCTQKQGRPPWKAGVVGSGIVFMWCMQQYSPSIELNILVLIILNNKISNSGSEKKSVVYKKIFYSSYLWTIYDMRNSKKASRLELATYLSLQFFFCSTITSQSTDKATWHLNTVTKKKKKRLIFATKFLQLEQSFAMVRPKDKCWR